MNDIDDLIVDYSPADRCPFFQVVWICHERVSEIVENLNYRQLLFP